VDQKQCLELLINLQGIDLQIRAIDNQISKLLKEKNTLEQNWLKSQEELENLKIQLEDGQKLRRKYDRELETKESDTKKYKAQILNVKTNREYKSLLQEINRAKSTSEQLEEEILKLMEANEGLQQQINDCQKKLEQERKRLEEEKQKLQTLKDKYEQEKENLKHQREQLKQGIEPKLLANYEQLLKTKAGTALTLAKDGVCQGCFIHLTPQNYEEIKKKDRIYSCPNCFRILYTEKRET
jgi:hypothetical protein